MNFGVLILVWSFDPRFGCHQVGALQSGPSVGPSTSHRAVFGSFFLNDANLQH